MPVGYLHILTESLGLSLAELHVQLLVPNSGLEGADCLVLGDVLHRIVWSGPLLDILSEGLILSLHIVLQLG